MRSTLARSALAAGAFGLVACSTDQSSTPTTTEPSDLRADACLVRLHGRSDVGTTPVVHERFLELSPNGNAIYQDGLQWLYFPEDNYSTAVSNVVIAIDDAGCRRVVLYGFSNGAAFGAKLYCRGEDFDSRLVGVVIDDPVPDLGTLDCAPTAGVPAVLYWTGSLQEAQDGRDDCEEIGWTCEGGSAVSIETTAAWLAVPGTPSPFYDHIPFRDAPEIGEWLLGS
ncbi:hypothetical protein BH24ACT5_BH24ACT5_00060 [soil metagenome]